jgi:hypothetical protein
MRRGTFRLIGLDEGGVEGTPDNLRLVCLTESKGKLAIWGRDGATGNIDKVLKAGLPCTIECEYREPNEIHRDRFGHEYWVRQDFDLTVTS